MAVYKFYFICLITTSLFIFIPPILAAAVNIEREENMICIPNATFHIDCNRCKCSPSGMSMDCTDWMCATLQIHHDLLLKISVSCKSKEIFLYNDLKCLCLADKSGEAVCSSARNELAHELRAANGDNRVISLAAARQCPTGLLFKSQYGDTCICHESHGENAAAAAAAACLGVVARDPPNSSGDEKQKLCVPFSSFSLDCNQCVCSNDGFSFSCDSYPCLGVEMRDDQLLRHLSPDLTLACAPSSLFLYNRHECLCSANGAHATCSLVVGEAVHHDTEIVVDESRDVCTPGVVFKDACNFCICGRSGKAACTMMDCEMGWDRRSDDDDARIVKKEDLWVQRRKSKRFCRKNDMSNYCRFLRKY